MKSCIYSSGTHSSLYEWGLLTFFTVVLVYYNPLPEAQALPTPMPNPDFFSSKLLALIFLKMEESTLEPQLCNLTKRIPTAVPFNWA